MVSAIELVAFEGVVFGYNEHGKPTIKIPEDAGEELPEYIRGGIRERIELVRKLPKGGVPHTAPFGACFACGDPMPSHKAGLCELCVCAREKVLEEASK